MNATERNVQLIREGLEAFSRGMAMGALLWPELTAATDGKPSLRSKSAAKKQAKKKAPKKAKKKKR